MLAAAEQGTLLLNELPSIPCSIQAQLQKLLEAREPDGDPAPDVRFVSTSSRRMDQLVETKSFRADLCYRLNVLPIEIPPLRRRLQDIPLLARYFLSRFEQNGRSLSLSEEAAVAISRYSWPGNVRQLRNCLERALLLSNNGLITPNELPPEVLRGTNPTSFYPAVSPTLAVSAAPGPIDSGGLSQPSSLRDMEKQQIINALEQTGWHRGKAAEMLGISPSTLYRRLRDYNLEGRLR